MSAARREGLCELDRAAIFRLRGLLPLPLVLIMAVWAEPTPTSFLVGGGLVLLGEAVRFWAAGYIRRYRVYEVQADALVTAGPYAHVRNPLYLGNLLIGLGFCTISNWRPAFPLFIVMYACMYRAVVAHEEDHLSALFGAEYERYRAEVPRFWPRLVPYSAAKGCFSAVDAFRGERLTWCVHTAAAALFAIKLAF